ncbi:GNAT family N-acetyltransferase [Romboutsia sp.]|uniref:GNAT family N-acetyltransferase n=1 Tax=Romboutsia sp. TaxID=1965302 RepID=UPI002BB4147F|nr:GNAT family N-acetyltransferase [Romboutsia sp.]HSQ87540.1 GNAT family N-acetyltransferase [Romboutsia sp.]
MDYTIEKIEFNMIEEAFSMIMKVFMEFDAPDYSQEGIETFRKEIIQNKEFKNRFKTGEQMMIGAFID